MKTIEKRGGNFATNYETLDDNGRAKNECEIARESYIAGAKEEHERLTRWNELKKPPEIPAGGWRSKRVLLKKESGDYATGWAELINGQIRWTDGRVVFSNLVGWREIHE